MMQVFFTIGCDRQWTPNRASEGAELQLLYVTIGSKLPTVPQAANYINTDSDWW